MVIETKVRRSGVWRTITDPQVRRSGVWRAIQQIQVRRSGVWRTVFELVTPVVTLTAQTGGPPPMASSVGMDQSGTAVWWLRADGTVDRDDTLNGVVQMAASTDWIIPNGSASSLYEWKWQQVSGDAPTSTPLVAENTWQDLGTDRKIGAFASFGQFEEGIVTLSIRFDGGSVLDSANFEWEAIGTDA